MLEHVARCRAITISLRQIAVLGVVFAAHAGLADSVRSSANYQMQFDVIAAGSGEMHSASFRQPQTVIGQEVIWFEYINSNFNFQPVGTIIIPYNFTSAVLWHLFN